MKVSVSVVSDPRYAGEAIQEFRLDSLQSVVNMLALAGVDVSFNAYDPFPCVSVARGSLRVRIKPE
jgi:hypothetical protein